MKKINLKLMAKIFLTFAIVMLTVHIVSSFTSGPQRRTVEEIKRRVQWDHINGGIHVVTFDKHEYIVVERSGIVHKEDCKYCAKNNLKQK